MNGMEVFFKTMRAALDEVGHLPLPHFVVRVFDRRRTRRLKHDT